MKKGSYGRSKLVSHSPVQRKWIFTANSTNFVDISAIAIFYVNSTDTNILTINNIGSPILSIPINQLRIDNDGFYIYDISKIIQTYNNGCYFFAWIDNTGEIPENQLLISANSGNENEQCLVYTPAIETLWLSGIENKTITALRGIYIKNPSLPLVSTSITEQNELRLIYGSPSK